MICLDCEYEYDSGDICPECGRSFMAMLKLEKERDKFYARLARSHIPWGVFGVELFILMIVGSAGFVAPLVFVGFVGLVLEFFFVILVLRPLKTNLYLRNAFCVLVLALGCLAVAWGSLMLIGLLFSNIVGPAWH